MTSIWVHLLRRIGKWCLLLSGSSVFAAIPADDVDWIGGRQQKAPVTLYIKRLFLDEATGNEFRLIRYPAGQMNPDHTHPVPHAMYVLEGHLVTHRGTFGPNTLVWFPANETMRHGAGPDEDVLVLLYTDSDLRTDYVASA